MKGIVFNVLERVVSEEHGEDAWDALLEAAGLSGAYTSVGSYDDAEMFALVDAACAALNTTPHDLLRWFGRRAMPIFAERYPEFFTPHRSGRTLVLALNDIIHPEVRKLYPGADVPTFTFEEDGPTIAIGYRSARKMCGFAEGLLLGAGDRFGETTSLAQPSCMLRGDAECTIQVTFAAA